MSLKTSLKLSKSQISVEIPKSQIVLFVRNFLLKTIQLPPMLVEKR